MIALWLGIKETLPVEKRITGHPLESVVKMFGFLKNSKFVRLILATGLVSGGLFSYISASSFVFQNFFHMSVQNFSLLYALNGIGIAIGSIIPGGLAARFPEIIQAKFVLATTVLTTILLTLSALFFNNLLVVIVLIFLTVTQFGMLFTLTTSIIMNLSLRNNGGLSALLGLSQNAIGGIMSPLVGVMGSHTYLPMALAIMGCMLFSMILFFSIHGESQNHHFTSWHPDIQWFPSHHQRLRWCHWYSWLPRWSKNRWARNFLRSGRSFHRQCFCLIQWMFIDRWIAVNNSWKNRIHLYIGGHQL